MAVKGYLTAEQRANDDLTHSEIKSLSNPFGNGTPFSITLYPRIPNPLVAEGFKYEVDCKLIGSTSVKPWPVRELLEAEKWSLRNFIYLDNSAQNQQLLTYFRIYTASGEYSPLN